MEIKHSIPFKPSFHVSERDEALLVMITESLYCSSPQLPVQNVAVAVGQTGLPDAEEKTHKLSTCIEKGSEYNSIALWYISSMVA